MNPEQVSQWGEKKLPPHVDKIINSDPDPEDFSPESVCLDDESMRDCLARILAYGVTKEPLVGPPTRDMQRKIDEIFAKIDGQEAAQYVKQKMDELYKMAFDRKNLNDESREAVQKERTRLSNVYCAYLDEVRNRNDK